MAEQLVDALVAGASVISYATGTGTKRNMETMRTHGWRLIVNALEPRPPPPGWRYALDNGAWSAFTRQQPFDVGAFERALERFGTSADWTVLPDVVAGGLKSLRFSLEWLQRVLMVSPRALLAVQDGMEPKDVEHHLGARVGLFVGGSTEWKWKTLPIWSGLGRRVGCWVHVGRVNSVRRIHACGVVGATSFDGTSPSRFAVTTGKLSRARDQMALFRAVA